jgi:hypothetical protein
MFVERTFSPLGIIVTDVYMIYVANISDVKVTISRLWRYWWPYWLCYAFTQ